MRQSTSRASSSAQISVEVDGGQVAGPAACSKPGTALGIGLGSTMNTSKSRLIASSALRAWIIIDGDAPILVVEHGDHLETKSHVT